MKLRPTQFAVCENTASSRQHAPRVAVDSRSTSICIEDENQETNLEEQAHAASDYATTWGERRYESRLLTIHEVAELLQVPVSWVYEHTRRRCIDRIPGFRLGKYWRFAERDVIAWLGAKRENGYLHGHESR